MGADTMTADVELLPLPEPPCHGKGWEPQYREADMRAYARACVAHATADAPSAEEDAMRDTMTETAPERIWLQIDPNGNADDRSEPCPDPSDVDLTWCWTQVGGQEVEYVRADLVRAAVRVDDVLLRVSDEDLRWCKDIIGTLQEAGGPTNNMRAVGLSRLIAALEAALGQVKES